MSSGTLFVVLVFVLRLGLSAGPVQHGADAGVGPAADGVAGGVADGAAAVVGDPLSALRQQLEAEPSPSPEWMWAALGSEIEAGRSAAVELLLQHGATADHRALVTAIGAGQAEIAELLMRQGAPADCPNCASETALMAAAAQGSRDLVASLLRRGADPNRGVGETAGPGTPLMIAARRGDLAMVKQLVAAGADVNGASAGFEQGGGYADHSCFTPLACAREAAHEEVVRYLEARGATRLVCWCWLPAVVSASGPMAFRSGPRPSAPIIAELFSPSPLVLLVTGFDNGWLQVAAQTPMTGDAAAVEGADGNPGPTVDLSGNLWTLARLLRIQSPLSAYPQPRTGPPRPPWQLAAAGGEGDPRPRAKAIGKADVVGATPVDCQGPWLRLRTRSGAEGWVILTPPP